MDFMEKHQQLALGLLRGLEGREESKKLWFQLTRIVNGISGPTRPMKSWIKVSCLAIRVRNAIFIMNLFYSISLPRIRN